MGQITGRIEKKDVKAFQWGNRISLKVGEKYYSIFENKIQREENKALFRSLKEGDEVQIEFVEEPSKDGRTVFNTIIDLVPVTQMDMGQSGVDSNPQNVSRDSRFQREDPVVKARSVALRYAIDWAIANLSGPAEVDILDLADSWADYITHGRQEG